MRTRHNCRHEISHAVPCHGSNAFSCVLSAVYAGSATWNLNATSGEWNTAANWTPTNVPEGASCVATFGLSNQTSVVFNANVELDQIVFDAEGELEEFGRE